MTTQEKKNNIKKYSLAVIEGTLGTTLLPSVAMAQMILETGYMDARYIKGNNLYGIKAAGKPTKYWDGSFVESKTFEYINGQRVDIVAKFRKYASETDSVKDRTEFLKNYSRYAKVFEATTYEGQCKAIHESGYATATDYYNILVNIIRTWNLDELDKKKKQ